ncbi:MAG: hypothetical protein D3906_02495 [Candidatus Electrothrix sp. AUS1_2]|nr:hypothetical protein [Candidatus Electrothrix sp. AUS1_2]
MRYFSVFCLLCFFFIGLINRAFGESFCGSFQITWPPGDQTSREFEVFSTYSQAESYCREKGSAISACFPGSSINVCSENPGYSVCWYSVPYGPQYFGAACTVCSDVDVLDSCLSDSNVVIDDVSSCSYHCKCPNYAGEQGYNFDTCTTSSCPDSDNDDLPDCCGGNLDCPDSDGDGIYDCCGDGAPCEDSDSDGVPDACDPCSDNPTITKKEICVYKVESTCDGVGSYHLGDVCGTWTTSCGDEDGCVMNGSGYIREEGAQCSFFCCAEERCDVVPCEVDPETCEPKTCECPNDEEACPQCQAADCECPDGQESCEECQLPEPYNSCECPDGEDVCEECQLPGCTCSDGSNACEECQSKNYCNCIGEPPCSQCQDPDCTCPDGQDYCQECQLPNIPPFFDSDGIPYAIQIGDCIIDFSEINEWVRSDESFPFNFINAIQGVLLPLNNASYTDDLILNYNIAPEDDPNFSDLKVTLDLSQYPVFVAFGRFVNWCLTMMLVLLLIKYIVKRYHTFNGISG